MMDYSFKPECLKPSTTQESTAQIRCNSFLNYCLYRFSIYCPDNHEIDVQGENLSDDGSVFIKLPERKNTFLRLTH